MSSTQWPDEDPLLGPAHFVFQTAVRAKKHAPSSDHVRRAERTRTDARAEALDRISRITKKKSEVMVKVTGCARGRRGIREHLSYITRNGKIAAEREGGDRVDGLAAVKDVAADWWSSRGGTGTTDDRIRPTSSRDTVNLILSMPAGTDPESLRAAVGAFVDVEFEGKYDFVMVVHTNDTDPSGKTEQPHAHVTIQTRGYNGNYLNPRKEDLQRWRELFAQMLRARGVEAEATPRRARGVVTKGRRQAVHHLENRRASHVSRWKVEQAIRTLQTGRDVGSHEEPWRAHSVARQRMIRGAWHAIATALDGEGQVALALQVRSFVDAMPAMELEADILLRRAKEFLDQKRSRPSKDRTR